MEEDSSMNERLNYSRFTNSKRSLGGAFFILLYITIIVSNFICVIKIIKQHYRRKKRTLDIYSQYSYGKAHAFIIVLSSSNIFFPLTLSPIILVPNFIGRWIGHHSACYASTFLLVTWTNISTIVSLFMGFERYVAVKKPFQYQRILTWYNFTLANVCMVIYCLMIAGLTIRFDMTRFYEQVPLCYTYYNLSSREQQGVLATSTITHSLCFILLTLTSILVLQELRQMHHRICQVASVQANSRDDLNIQRSRLISVGRNPVAATRKTAKVTILVTTVHLISWLPGRIAQYWMITTGTIPPSAWRISILLARIAETIIIPLIIIVSRKKNIRRYLKRLF
ncbi:uncharacterized protein TRIADDRAFT_53369 [Trichoplax adhaerens]|uniref:G-protein coupled receptors family 1 profile domain-containing protein n=1 Tax=Trichoplax adhaerens TaxID=10228 RepID=B3RP17_TRIAD|nr:hypothetical protein TRIADDRAFT_53369 [Trichoplax adhaerens]EDV27556.1 hypothetical protein TRIADDRAFT_53369 [Trichoplax adhaerens]|eukprot:XP_002109390.1 hypothetical protein TRIADDRAFT_53369 [Trichoplax adhaerens]